MAIEKTININVDSKDAEKNLGKVVNQFEGLGEEANKSIKNIEKGVDAASKSTKSLSAGFKSAGLALKAMGVGLVIEAFNILKDLFQSNQVIADKFGTAFKALSIAFNDFFNYINKNAGGIVDFFKNIFENPVESLKQFGQLIKENIIERFNSALEVAGFMADALKKLFKGDFAGALASVKEAGKEMVDVFTGVDDTVGKVGDLANAAANYAKETFRSAEALQAQENAALRAVAIQAGLVEQYDRQAELQRQIRDDDTKSIQERIKANDELAKVLDEQEKAMLAQANLQVQAAANQYRLNKSIENEVALIEANNNVKGVQAQIDGLRSEQKSNEIALNKESNELLQSEIDTRNELSIKAKEFEEQQETDAIAKLERQKELLELQQELDLADLERKKLLYKEGTQARQDAENEYLLKQQEIQQALTTNEKEQTAARITIAEAERKAKEDNINAVSNLLGNIASLLGEQTAAGKAAAIAQATISTYQSAVQSYQSLSGIPIIGPALGAAAAGVAVASGIANVKKILAVKTPNGGGGGSAPTATAVQAPNAPQFNVVGNTGVNQIAQTLGSQQPVQAYVVAGNVTTAQSLNRNIINNATLG
jgi:hypothetical protein